MNPYELLEIPADASAEMVKAAYLRLAKQWHPDRYTGEEKLKAEERFRAINEAFNLLKDPARRPQVPAPATAAASPKPAPTPTGPPPQERTAEDWFKEAQEMLSQGNRDRALALVQYAIRMEGNRAAFYGLQAQLLEAGGDIRGASRSLEAGLRQNSRDVDAMLHLADLYEQQGMKARAQGLTEQARKLQPRHKRFTSERSSSERKSTGKASAPAPSGLVDQAKALWSRLTGKG
ncbi:MAG TPA: DnaJ domain-containing protein [Holophagaceae bacterium]|nr:DnaJ domain-containing protein [Holophagaceae bacterium]